MSRNATLFALSLLALAACGPVPLEVAEQRCLERAQAAQGPQGTISVQIDNQGNVSTGLTLGVTSDYLAGRDPAQVYQECVFSQSGQMPIHPYPALPKS